jgi:foldase protein PrsA
MKIKQSGGIIVNNIKKLLSAALIAAFTVGAVGCSMIEKTEEAKNRTVLAKVGSAQITKAKLDEKMADVITQLKSSYGEDYSKNEEALETYKTEAKTYLEDLITEEILLQKAKEYNLVPDASKMDEEVQKELDNIKKNYFDNDQKKFDEGIVQYGYTLDTLKDQIKEQITTQKDQVAASRAYQYILKDINVTDDEIKNYYEQNKETAFTEGAGAELSHILVPTEEQAKEIRRKISEGAAFEDMAKQFGTDGTKDDGGKLGFYPYDTTQLDADFMAGAKTLKEGEVSQPVKTQFGFHLIKATNITADKKVTPIEEVKDQIKSSLLQEKQNTEFTSKLEQWKKELKVKTYEKRL